MKEELREDGRAPLGVKGFRAVAHSDLRLALSQLKRLRALPSDVILIASQDQFEYRNRLGVPLE